MQLVDLVFRDLNWNSLLNACSAVRAAASALASVTDTTVRTVSDRKVLRRGILTVDPVHAGLVHFSCNLHFGTHSSPRALEEQAYEPHHCINLTLCSGAPQTLIT